MNYVHLGTSHTRLVSAELMLEYVGVIVDVQILCYSRGRSFSYSVGLKPRITRGELRVSAKR
jgi:hypothetical protein